jgi:hypothetical protein
MQTLRARLTHPITLFFLLTALGYGLLLPYTGFYWDDWPFAWIAKFLGPAEFIPAFAPFRPFLGPIFYFTTSLIPPIPLYWQVFALIVRLLMGVATWWTFKQIWPQRPHLALTVALLLLVFPGYSQHWVAYTHINQELIPFLFHVLSFGFTFKALHEEHPRIHVVIALLLQLCGIFPTEYFFGMEGLRGLLLFFNTQGNFPARIRQTLNTWWPYLLIWLLNAVWLVYYYRFGPYNSYEVSGADETTHLGLLPEILDTLWKVCFYIWGQILVLLSTNLLAPSSLLTIGLIAVSFVLLRFYSSLFEGKIQTRDFARSLIVIGLLGILLGRLPSLAAGLPLRLQSSYDRFMVSMMIAGSLFILGLIELIFQNPRHRAIAVSALIALGVGQQFFNANIFRRDWENQTEIYWQLTWRIPALEPNTVLLTHQMPIDYETDLSFTAPINWMYAPDFTPPNLPYALLYTEKRLGGSTLPSLEPDTPIHFPYRTVDFRGNTSQAVVIYKPANGCLRVLDPARGDADVYANLPSELTDAIPLSSYSQIITSPERSASPSFLFIEPEDTWCYYFTRAELAYQMNNFAKVVSLQKAAESLEYQPRDLNEWLIFIEANIRTANIEDAEQLSMNIIRDEARMRRGVCTVWARMQAEGASGTEEKFTEIISGLQCPK